LPIVFASVKNYASDLKLQTFVLDKIIQLLYKFIRFFPILILLLCRIKTFRVGCTNND